MDCHITHKTEASHKNEVTHLFLWLLKSASWCSEMCGLNFQVDLGEHPPHVIPISPRASATAAAADAAIYRNIRRQSDCHVFGDEQSFPKLGAVFDRKYCVKSTEKLLLHCLNTVILWQVCVHRLSGTLP